MPVWRNDRDPALPHSRRWRLRALPDRRNRTDGVRRMICDSIEAFAPLVPTMRPVAGLDLGTRTIGVALSDRLWSVATPLETIKRSKFSADASRLMDLLTGREAGGIVLGLPLNMDGSEGPRVQSTRAFARNLTRLTDLPIAFWDERLSTVAAERALLEADTSRKRRAEVIDHVAAAYILQGALDRLAHLRRAATSAQDNDG